MLDGELEFLDGDHRFTAVAGDFVHVPGGIRHCFQNKRMHAAKMLFMFTPPGPEQVIADYAMPARDGETPPVPDEEQLARFETMVKLARTISLPDRFDHLPEVADHLLTADRDGAAGRTIRARMVRAGLQAISALPVTLRFTSPTDAAAIAPYFNRDALGTFVPAELPDRFFASVDRSADRGDFLFAFTMWITQGRVPVHRLTSTV